MTAMIEPVTTGRNGNGARDTSGTNRMPKGPQRCGAEDGVDAERGVGRHRHHQPPAAKVTPIMIGRRMPKRPTPSALDDGDQAAAQQVGVDQEGDLVLRQPSAPPTISGTAIAAGIHPSTCGRGEQAPAGRALVYRVELVRAAHCGSDRTSGISLVVMDWRHRFRGRPRGRSQGG